jgi:TonB family protein
MSRITRGMAGLALLLTMGAAAWGQSSAPAAAAGSPQDNAAPETVRVQLVNRIPTVDRGNLKDYWTAVQSQTKDRWMQGLPALARPPASTAGEVKIEAWLHTDGRVTGMVLEQGSGKVALDRAAWAAITGSAPYDAFPYGISVNQVRVRFTFLYNGGSEDNPGTGTSPGLAGVKPRPHP